MHSELVLTSYCSFHELNKISDGCFWSLYEGHGFNFSKITLQQFWRLLHQDTKWTALTEPIKLGGWEVHLLQVRHASPGFPEWISSKRTWFLLTLRFSRFTWFILFWLGAFVFVSGLHMTYKLFFTGSNNDRVFGLMMPFGILVR